MKVVIMCGGAGYKVGDRFKLALRGDVVDVSAEEAEAMIGSGAARAVKPVETSPKAESATGEKPENAGDVSTPPSPENEADGAEEAEGVVYSMDNTATELKAIMEANGLSVKARMTKREMVDALDAFYGSDEETDDDEQPPDLNSEALVI